MEASFFASYQLPSLSQVRIYDNSVFDDLTPYDINATRLLFSTVNSRNNANTQVTEIIAFKEYIVTFGVIFVNGRTFVTGDTIYMANNASISSRSSNYKVAETGFYGIRSTYLPTESYVSYTPGQMLYGENGLYFTDNVVTLKYELYSTKYSAGVVSVSEETQFIVTGNQGNSITISGQTFYVGEVFKKTANFTFSNASGTNYVVKFEASTEKNFRTWYYNWILWSNYFNTISTSYQVSQSFLADFLAVTARINQCDLYDYQNFNTSLQSVQDLMNDVNSNYQIK